MGVVRVSRWLRFRLEHGLELWGSGWDRGGVARFSAWGLGGFNDRVCWGGVAVVGGSLGSLKVAGVVEFVV